MSDYRERFRNSRENLNLLRQLSAGSGKTTMALTSVLNYGSTPREGRLIVYFVSSNQKRSDAARASFLQLLIQERKSDQLRWNDSSSVALQHGMVHFVVFSETLLKQVMVERSRDVEIKFVVDPNVFEEIADTTFGIAAGQIDSAQGELVKSERWHKKVIRDKEEEIERVHQAWSASAETVRKLRRVEKAFNKMRKMVKPNRKTSAVGGKKQ